MKSLAEAVEAANKAQALYKAAREALALANRNECSALNAVNEAQEMVDKIVSALRQAAPDNSDWKRPRGEQNFGG